MLADIAFILIIFCCFIVGGALIVCVDFFIYSFTDWSFFIWLDQKFYGVPK